MSTSRKVLAEVPSGTVELAHNGLFNILQYNCDCMDALEYCNAACCKTRSGYNVILEPGEETKFKSKPHRLMWGKYVLQSKADDSCIYLEDNKCTVHNDKPTACRSWHCSPLGKGDGISYRDGGWVLLPALHAGIDQVKDEH